MKDVLRKLLRNKKEKGEVFWISRLWLKLIYTGTIVEMY